MRQIYLYPRIRKIISIIFFHKYRLFHVLFTNRTDIVFYKLYHTYKSCTFYKMPSTESIFENNKLQNIGY